MISQPTIARLARNHGLDFFILIGAVFTCFYKLPQFFFTQDDFQWLYLARYRWSDWGSLISIYHGGFTPILNIMTKIFYVFFGLNPRPYHLGLGLLHFMNSVLVYLFSAKITGNRRVALISSVFFATTFSHWEAILWLSGGSHMVSTFFTIATVLCWSCFLNKRTWQPYALTLICFGLGLLSKENCVPLVFMIALQTMLLGPETSEWNLKNRAFWYSLSPFIVLFVLYFGLRMAANLPPTSYPLTFGFKIIWAELAAVYMLLAPDASSPFTAPHLMKISKDFYGFLLQTQKIVTGCLPFIMVFCFLKRRKLVDYLLVWVLIFSAPQVFIDLTLASRYLYLPSVGFSILVGIFCKFLFDRSIGYKRALFVFGVILVLLANTSVYHLAAKSRIENSRERRQLISSILQMLEKVPEEMPVRLVNFPFNKYNGMPEALILFGKHANIGFLDAKENSQAYLVDFNRKNALFSR